MTTVGIFMMILSVAAWIAITIITTHILKDNLFKQFLMFRKHKKMLAWIIILSALALILAAIGGSCIGLSNCFTVLVGR